MTDVNLSEETMDGTLTSPKAVLAGLSTLLSLDLSPDAVYETIGVSRRRHLITLLSQAPSNQQGVRTMPLDEAAAEIAVIETGDREDDLDPDARQRVYVSLVQQHVPYLADLGLLTYHDRAKKVEAEDGLDQLAALIMAVNSMCAPIDGSS